MESLYLIIVLLLFALAVCDLFVGVSNDAVNFLTSSIGAKVAKMRTVLIVASVGILLGALMSAGMMDVARHGVMHPEHFSFHEVTIIFLAVMVTDVIILDVFNTLGLPTSTTVSMVFELLGGAFCLSIWKIHADNSLSLNMLLNSDKALQMIIAIFVSVGIAFVFGTIVQFIARVLFTFNYRKAPAIYVVLFGGISLTILCYFMFIKGISASPFITATVKAWINNNFGVLIAAIFFFLTAVSWVLHILKVNVFGAVVLVGTFALAMAFAGNALVNFIGVPMAELSSWQDFTANSQGFVAGNYMMKVLSTSAKPPIIYLFLAGLIMIIAINTSKKAQNVVRTSVDLSRQDEGEEMFGSSRVARSIVRVSETCGTFMSKIMPHAMSNWIDNRFNKKNICVTGDPAAFDVVRASINVVISAVLIIFGTLCKLPLSTTYVTFMVAMGASLADRAWSRDTAVFRVTGVLSVIGGWFTTAGVAFITCAIVCSIMYLGGFVAMTTFIVIVILLLVRSNMQYSRKLKEERKDDISQLMLRCKDPEIVLDLLFKHVRKTQSGVAEFVLDKYNNIIEGLKNDDLKQLKQTQRALEEEKTTLKKIRKKEYLALRRIPRSVALERNTWFHIGSNSSQQAVYCLKRMLEPAIEHVDNNFKPMPGEYAEDYEPVRRKVNDLFTETAKMISTHNYSDYKQCLDEAKECKHTLSSLRKQHLDSMHDLPVSDDYNLSVVYLNLLQETQELLSVMRHQLRSAKKFLSNQMPIT